MIDRWRINLWLVLHIWTGLSYLAAAKWGFEFFGFLLASDITFISFVILGLYVLISIWIGYYILTAKNSYEISAWPIFISENLMSLGLIGTLVGMVVAIGALFEMDLTNHAQATEGIKNLSGGVAAAMITTLVGLVSGLLSKMQLLILKESIEEYDRDGILEETNF